MNTPLSNDQLARAMDLIAANGWRMLSMMDLSVALDLSLVELYQKVPSKWALLERLMAYADQAVAREAVADLRNEPEKDRLFALLMARLDALTPFKAAIQKMADDWRRDPVAAAAAGLILGRSLAFMLEAAGISASGPQGGLRTNGLGLIYLSTLRVWLKDESPDLTKTMAELDRRLTQADQWVARLNGFFKGAPVAAKDQSTEPV